MELVEERGVGRQVRLDEGARVLVSGRRRQQALATEDTPRIRIGHEDGPMRGIEQNGVDRLRAKPRHRQELPPQRPEGRSPEAVEAAAEPDEQPFRERTQPTGLQTVRAGGANHVGQLGLRDGHEPLGREQSPLAKRRHRARGARPGGVLGEDRTDCNLEGGAARPPVLRAVSSEQVTIEPQQPGLHRIMRRPGNRPSRPQHRAG